MVESYKKGEKKSVKLSRGRKGRHYVEESDWIRQYRGKYGRIAVVEFEGEIGHAGSNIRDFLSEE